MKPNDTKHRAPANKGKKYPPEILTRNEVHRLIGACSRGAPTGVRNGALIGLLFGSGVRVGEALALRPKDIDRDAGTVRATHEPDSAAQAGPRAPR